LIKFYPRDLWVEKGNLRIVGVGLRRDLGDGPEEEEEEEEERRV